VRGGPSIFACCLAADVEVVAPHSSCRLAWEGREGGLKAKQSMSKSKIARLEAILLLPELELEELRKLAWTGLPRHLRSDVWKVRLLPACLLPVCLSTIGLKCANRLVEAVLACVTTNRLLDD
jgi:hypothetical protein